MMLGSSADMCRVYIDRLFRLALMLLTGTSLPPVPFTARIVNGDMSDIITTNDRIRVVGASTNMYERRVRQSLIQTCSGEVVLADPRAQGP